MKAISLTQPYATLIALLLKTNETRSWATSYRGPLAIHAAQGLGPVGGKAGLRALCQSEPFASALTNAGLASDGSDLPRGCVVALSQLVDCMALTKHNGASYRWNANAGMWVQVGEPEASFGDYTKGRYGFQLDRIRALLGPIPAKGALGLWEWNTREVLL